MNVITQIAQVETFAGTVIVGNPAWIQKVYGEYILAVRLTDDVKRQIAHEDEEVLSQALRMGFIPVKHTLPVPTYDAFYDKYQTYCVELVSPTDTGYVVDEYLWSVYFDRWYKGVQYTYNHPEPYTYYFRNFVEGWIHE